MKYISYIWTIIKNLIVLAIAIAVFGKADSDYEKIVFSLLVLIYLSISWSITWQRMVSGASLIALGREFWRIKKLLKEGNISNTTLNPVFSEEEIAGWKEASEKSQRDVERLFDQLCKKEREEIKAHHEAGKDKSSFEPSETLLSIIKEESIAITLRNNAQENYEKMIKANLAVLNGASIEEVKKGCKLHTYGILGLNKGTYDPEEFLKRRKEYWETCWDSILKKEDPSFEESAEVKDEEEERIIEAEKKMDEAWIKVYIEGFFTSILFLITLWHLLKGLYII